MENKTPVRALLARCASAESRGSWEEFVARFGGMIHAGVRQTLQAQGDEPLPEDVEDLRQEVYCRLLARGRRNLRHFRGRSEDELTSYLQTIVRSVVLEHLRRRAARKRGGAGALPILWGLGHATELPGLRLDDRSGSPELRLLVAERRRRWLERCQRVIVEQCSRRDLRVLRLAFFRGLSSPEISRALGGQLAPSSVDSVVHRARRRLAACGLPIPRR